MQSQTQSRCGEKVRGRDIAGEGVVDMGEQGETKEREVSENQRVYGPEQPRDHEGRQDYERLGSGQRNLQSLSTGKQNNSEKRIWARPFWESWISAAFLR